MSLVSGGMGAIAGNSGDYKNKYNWENFPNWYVACLYVLVCSVRLIFSMKRRKEVRKPI